MTASTVTVDSAGNKSIPVNIVTITEPVAHHSRKLYAQAATGAQWYAEQWEDLLVEARHMALGTSSHVKVADVMADLANAKVVSDIPGRLRVRLKELKWQDQLLAESAQALGSRPGIQQVETSAITGSILIHYDAARYGSRAALMDALVAPQAQ